MEAVFIFECKSQNVQRPDGVERFPRLCESKSKD
jgi:hypothetical protein